MAQPKIIISRYDHPEQIGWSGHLEPDDKSWIVFFGPAGRVKLFDQRGLDGSVESSSK